MEDLALLGRPWYMSTGMRYTDATQVMAVVAAAFNPEYEIESVGESVGDSGETSEGQVVMTPAPTESEENEVGVDVRVAGDADDEKSEAASSATVSEDSKAMADVANAIAVSLMEAMSASNAEQAKLSKQLVLAARGAVVLPKLKGSYESLSEGDGIPS